MARYKVAIIGSTGRGDYGHGLDAVWQKFEDCEVVSVADQDSVGCRKLSVELARLDLMPNTVRCSTKNVQTLSPFVRWTDQHRDMVLACAEFGCHIYMEKPFAERWGGGRDHSGL
jgi:predicted dehydrogenase